MPLTSEREMDFYQHEIFNYQVRKFEKNLECAVLNLFS